MDLPEMIKTKIANAVNNYTYNTGLKPNTILLGVQIYHSIITFEIEGYERLEIETFNGMEIILNAAERDTIRVAYLLKE